MKVRHIVILEAKEPIDEVMGELEKLAFSLPGCIDFSHGQSCSLEGLNREKNHSFTIDFQSIDDLKHYLDHPEHIAIAQQKIIPAMKNGLDSILAFDHPLI